MSQILSYFGIADMAEEDERQPDYTQLPSFRQGSVAASGQEQELNGAVSLELGSGGPSHHFPTMDA